VPANNNGADRLLGPDLVLLLLSAPAKNKSAMDRINGITRLEKLLFLAGEEAQISSQVDDGFKFHAYNYGPYSKEVYEAVDLLEGAGLITEERVYEGIALDEEEEIAAVLPEREGVERRFALTADGKAVANLLAGRHADVMQAISDVKDKYAAMSLRQLLRYVYTRYPPMAEQSTIRHKIL